MSAALPRRILFVVPPAAFYPSTTVRVRQFLPHLARIGIASTELSYQSAARERWYVRLIAGPRRIRWGPARQVARALLRGWSAAHLAFRHLQLLAKAHRFDLVFVQYVLPPVWVIRWLARGNVRLVYDFDDAVFLRDPVRARAMVSRAWRVVAGSHFNRDYALQHNPHTVLVPSAVPVEQYPVALPAAAGDGITRIGWIGGPATLQYLALIAEPLRRLQAAGAPIELLIAGSRDRPDLIPAFGDVSVTLVPTYSAADLPELVARMDIGVMPLVDGAWERGKCAMKALVYMAGGRPAVCSPVGEANYVVEDGASGLLADGPDEWERHLSTLIHSPALRRSMGERGREIARLRYSTEACFRLLVAEVLEGAAR